MFAKLLKHELRSTGAVMGVLSLAALGLGLLGGLDLMFLVRFFETTEDENSAMAVLAVLLMLGLFVIFLGLMAYAVGSSIFILIRFYRNKFTDEGYLTFTLPVNTHQIFLSSWISLVIWNLVISAVMMLSFLLVISFGLLPVKDVIAESMGEMFSVYDILFGTAWESVKDSMGVSVVHYLLSAVVQLLQTPLLYMTSIVLGATVAKKHKLLAAVGFYYLISTISSTVLSFVSAMAMVASLSTDAVNEVARITMILQPLLQIVMGVCAYFLSVHLMGKKLNLP